MLKPLLIVTIVACLIACENNSPDDFEREEVVVSPPSPEIDSTTVTYTNTVSTIMTNHCLQCHSNPTRNGAPFSLTTFQEVRSRAAAVNTAMNDVNDPMPPSGRIAASQREQIQEWIDNGLPE